MGLQQRLRALAAAVIIERPARKTSLSELSARLESSGAEINSRAAIAADAESTRKTLRHISGIERWGQSRLRVFLGEPAIDDEYGDYRPSDDLSVDEARAFFMTTRAQTIDLVDRLDRAGVAPDARSLHNGLGPLTVRGWLRYLEMHARLESKRMR